VKAGPDNPLGDYAMRLAAGHGTYLIHGTNNPMAVGMAITHGCVRMYPEDVAALFPLIPVGTKVWLINEPVKVAFADGELLMEAHPAVDDEGQNTADPNMELLSQKLDQALGSTTAAIHWDFAKQALQAANGIPTVVGIQADMSPEQAEAAEAADSSSPAPHPDAPDAPGGASSAGTTTPAATSDSTHQPAQPATSDQHPAQQTPGTGAAPTAAAGPEAPATEPTSPPAETTLSQVSPARDAAHPSAAAHSVAAPEPQAAVPATAAADPHHQ